MTLGEYLHTLKGRRVAVIGIGVSNTPLIRLLLRADVEVIACDRRERPALGPLADELEAQGCRLHLGKDYLERLQADVVFRTPELQPKYLERLPEQGCVITSEMEAFFEVCPCKTIGITGSDGKTTTTTIVAELLKAAGRKVHVGGNIGRPLLADAAEMDPEDIAEIGRASCRERV